MRHRFRSTFALTALLGAVLVFASLGGCSHPSSKPYEGEKVSGIELSAYRFRGDSGAGLNEDAGWAGPENSRVQLSYDTPFRMRVQVRAKEDLLRGVVLGLQFRRDGGEWTPIGVSEFPYPAFSAPAVSVISATAYEHGAETDRLLGAPGIDWDEGAGLSGNAETPAWNAGTDAVEWEWPLVVRRFADGPTFMEDGETLEIRVVDGLGRPLATEAVPQLSMRVPDGHLGGTFVETPGRIGPYQAESGKLYFFMEPTETDNRFMAVVSDDFGRSWREADPDGRPVADDLEGVASARVGDTVHIVHQVTRQIFHHAFRMDGPGPARWQIDSDIIANHDDPPTQFADLVARSDGSQVALYAGPEKLFLQIRSSQGGWDEPYVVDDGLAPELSGPVLATGPGDVVTMAYTGRDGSGFVRHLYPNGELTARQVLSTRLGTTDAENGAILPMVVSPESGTSVVLFREENGLLHERRFSREGALSDPVRISDLPVVTNAVDSEQVGADLVQYGSTLHLVFIEETSRSVFYSYSERAGVWSEPQLLIDGIEAAWLRGSVHRDQEGQPVYGFVYDGGSRGGAGFNRYFAVPLGRASQ